MAIQEIELEALTRPSDQWMLTFRTSITFAVMAFIIALAALLITIQVRALHLATQEAASAFMDATSSKALGRLQMEITAMASLVRVLATSSSVADSNESIETSPAINLFKAALQELPQMDSIYVGFENGAWLEVRRTSDLNEEQRERLRATPRADIAINLIRPCPDGELPMRRIFEDRQGNEVGQLNLWKYGYDPRKRPWYHKTLKADRSLVSFPYLSFDIDAPVMTISTPLRGKVHGVVAADLKLDTFNDFVQSQRPGEHGIVLIFDAAGSLIAHPDFGQFVTSAMTHPSQPQLPNIKEINSGVAAAVLRGAHGRDQYDGNIRDDQGNGYLFRLAKFTLGEQHSGRILLLAAQGDFVQNVRRLQVTGLIVAIVAGAVFVPVVWIFGSGMSRSLKDITAQAARLQKLAAPDPSPVPSRIKEICELGSVVNLAQRTIRSFARFVPKEIVRGVMDNSISAELGGVREEVTVVFTDVGDFTTIAESADPDMLMHQTTRYFSVLTEAFLAEGGTVDKFIGDAVMVFWNAPNPQPDHVERACRAVLSGKMACERLNAQFEAEGLKPFFTRFGIHVGEAVVGNLGSTERMNYTALGNTVNLAARLEGLNKRFGTAILASEDVYLRVRHRFQFRPFDAVITKGMTKETRIFELVGAPT
ncbi:adenylate/guanylate cyclase domain-containing protein [Bradyrhizobium sp. CB82]|uniref:adenylate/guanylate cyclase domain-containing protein n=1 Tax=Bradyrhizobium sp. CB82 TaxID=3039159 RepID=UPI0024B1DB7E|nr:adenylate/guanylate cyclase domain-containing protein [Bradyrhizobium sp. CB82]WFU39089.1 adenylate/guanylate cyclase domain-containing protein [Bradyrhizobium sp. CB82]